MKKILLLFPILFVIFCTLISCGSKECEHSFKEATCKSPKTCELCGITEGPIVGHSYAPASCISPMACVHCGITAGGNGAHTWKNATCTEPSTCEICGVTNGYANGHDWNAKLCTWTKFCKVCFTNEAAKEHIWDTNSCLATPVCIECDFVGNQIFHNWENATCITPQSCTRCGETSGVSLGHDWKITSCKNPKVCQRCNESSIDGLPHQWTYKGCDKQRMCSVCSKEEGFVYGHKWIDATCQNPIYCELCEKTQGGPAEHKWQEATCSSPKLCTICETTLGDPLGHNWELTSIIEAACEEEKQIYFCNRCNGNLEVGMENAKYGYHICNAEGFCTQCNQQYDISKMALESVLIKNEHSVEFCGIFTSEETKVKIYKPITSFDVGMPVVNLGGALPPDKSVTNVVDFTYDSDDLSFVCTAEIKVQGASSAGKPKKNFNIKLYDDSESKKKVELVDGWGRESKYCMKANYIDYSQSRNVVSGKIFGEIVKSRNDELYGTPNGGAIDGFPILVYNDGVFLGIYTMNIPKDKWMFNMHDSDEKNQAIIMTDTWNSVVSFRDISKDISQSGFVVEYVSNEDSTKDNSSQWALDSLTKLIEFVYNNDGEDFKNGIHEYADIDKCIDSMIYTFFICADDNTSKNILWVTLDGKVWFSSMYDMDGTWGMRWNGNIEFNEYTHPITALVDGRGLAPERDHDDMNLLWERIYVNYFDRVCERYSELRQDILSLENISYHFESFFSAIPDAVREAEKQKWTVPSQDIDHLNQILSFAEKRIKVMDKILMMEEEQAPQEEQVP